jgi:hypothetical protein
VLTYHHAVTLTRAEIFKLKALAVVPVKSYRNLTEESLALIRHL